VHPQPAATHDEGLSPASGRVAGQQRGYLRPRALLLLFRHSFATTPWVTLISGCVVSTGILAVFAYVAHKYHSPLSQTTVRLWFIAASATLAFVPRTLLRPLTQTTPVPAWLATAIQALLAFAVLALTCWVQLSLMAYTIPRHTVAPAIYPLIAELTAWSTIFVAVAACCDRSRFADIGGVIAVPISCVLVVLFCFTPGVKDLFAAPPATLGASTVAWYSLGAAALVMAYAAMRDRWHRYTRMLARGIPNHRPRVP
jgi:hypothetical protein